MRTTAMIIDNFTDGAKPCGCDISADGQDLVLNLYDFIIHVKVDDALEAIKEVKSATKEVSVDVNETFHDH